MALNAMGVSYDPLMHASGSYNAHCLPVAGLRPPVDADVYRYNRVVPLYTPDPCIGPNSTQLICPPDCGQQKRNDLMEPAGRKTPIEMQFQFYQPRPSRHEPKLACNCPVFANRQPCNTLGPITDRLKCPCINRPSVHPGQFQGDVIGSPSMLMAKAPHSQHTLHLPVEQPYNRTAMRTQPNMEYMPINYTSHPNSNFHAYGDNIRSGLRYGAVAPTPNVMMHNGSGGSHNRTRKMLTFSSKDLDVDYCCQNPYYSSRYVCRPVYDRKYLDDCPEQDGPPADTYTFL